MNQMLKKASTTCAAFACAASLMFSGAAVVWADGEIDETVKNQIETYAEGLTDEIIGLSDDQIEQYMESDDAFTSSAMTAWDGTKDDLGELKETGDVEIEYSDDEYTAVVPVEFEKEDAEFTYVFDKNLTPTSLAVDIQYSFGTTMKNAALNTLMGIGTVFVILAMLIFLISLFKYIPGSGAQQVKKKKEEAARKESQARKIAGGAGGFQQNAGFTPRDTSSYGGDDGSTPTGVLNEGSSATTVLSNANMPNATLIRKKTNERITVNKAEFKIGKERRKVDYRISDNTSISRLHATIIYRNGSFYIVDNNATNGTSVNGSSLAANTEKALAGNETIRLADEEFIFRC